MPAPAGQWTHGVEIDAPADEVFGWVAQIGADRAGFYSYQWLENLVGCDVQNADRVRPEWRARVGDELKLHPKLPGLRITEVVDGRYVLAVGEAGPNSDDAAASWLFLVEPLSPTRCRFISRFRIGHTPDEHRARRRIESYVTESVGFVMDRRMLLGVKERAERAARAS